MYIIKVIHVTFFWDGKAFVSLLLVFFQGVVMHFWAYPKLSQIVIQLYSKNELNYKVSFVYMVSDP